MVNPSAGRNWPGISEFFADGKWVPVDISEADKNSSLADIASATIQRIGLSSAKAAIWSLSRNRLPD